MWHRSVPQCSAASITNRKHKEFRPRKRFLRKESPHLRTAKLRDFVIFRVTSKPLKKKLENKIESLPLSLTPPDNEKHESPGLTPHIYNPRPLPRATLHSKTLSQHSSDYGREVLELLSSSVGEAPGPYTPQREHRSTAQLPHNPCIKSIEWSLKVITEAEIIDTTKLN